MQTTSSGECSNSYTGVVNNLFEATMLLEAARVGLLPRISRRLTDAEKNKYIKPGSVFLFEEEESGIVRWTDLHKWSASRVSGSFLLYTAHTPEAHIDDTLIKQSFFSVDKAGARMHLIAYSSRRYRQNEGSSRSTVSDDPLFKNLRMNGMEETSSSSPSIVSVSLRPRLVNNEHCFALLRNSASLSPPLPNILSPSPPPPPPPTVLLPLTMPTASNSSILSAPLPTTSTPTTTTTTTTTKTTTTPISRYRPTKVQPLAVAMDPSEILSRPSIKRRQFSPRQPLVMPLPILVPPPAPRIQSPLAYANSLLPTSVFLDRSEIATRPNLTHHHSTSNLQQSRNINNNSFQASRKFSTIQVSIPVPISSNGFSLGQHSTRSRSLSPILPRKGSFSSSPSISTPPADRSCSTSNSQQQVLPNRQNRYQPYSPSSPKFRIASLSSKNLSVHDSNNNSNLNPINGGGGNLTLRPLHRSVSFDTSMIKRRREADLDSEDYSEDEEILRLRGRGIYGEGSGVRNAEDIRVLALLGKFSTTVF